MKRHGTLFPAVASAENLWRAWRTFRRHKRSRPDVRAFELEADRRVIGLSRRLHAGSYRPSGYRLLGIHEPKRRLIASAPVIDRVVHHALYRVLAPLLDPGLIDTVYACLPGRGSHRALLAFVSALRRYRYVLCLDVRHYFLSIDHALVLGVMSRRIKDTRVLDLLGVILESGRGLYRSPAARAFLELELGFPPDGAGLPIGNLTSQWWGNHYLSGLDHFIKRELAIPHYQRYMDDLTLFADSREALEHARTEVARWLRDERRLRLKHPEAPVRHTGGKFLYLGHHVRRTGISVPPSLLRRMQERVGEQVLSGSVLAIERSVASYQGVWGGPDLSRLRAGQPVV
jgi:RNA-directed DNA polymerase